MSVTRKMQPWLAEAGSSSVRSKQEDRAGESQGEREESEEEGAQTYDTEALLTLSLLPRKKQ